MNLTQILMTVTIATGICVGMPLGVNAFSGGDGSSDNPYVITTASELDEVRENLSAHYKLGNDIDLNEYLAEGGNGYAKWGEAGWEPIGKPDELGYECFTGSFDGAHHMISGLWINREDINGIGLFGSANSYDGCITIQNLGINITEDNIVGKNNVGGLIGYSNAKIRNCYVTGGSVIGTNSVGGLIGSQSVTGELSNSYAKVDVISREDSVSGYFGGAIGHASGIIKNSYAIGKVKGSKVCGGLVGCLEVMASVENSHATGIVESSGDCAGGLIGYCNDAIISNSSSASVVRGKNYVGGLVGHQSGLSSINECFSNSTVSATGNYVGGLVGAQISGPYYNNFNRITNSYVKGSIETLNSEYIGAISGYLDEESNISNCYRYNDFTVNNTILENEENSQPDKINGGIVAEEMVTLAQSPIINFTLSETESTKKPVKITLDITTLGEISSVNCVKVSQENPSLDNVVNGDYVSVDHDVDLDLLMTDLKQYSSLVNGYENATIINNYYKNEVFSDNIQMTQDNSFEINQNGWYIICVEDVNENKTFLCINISNIEISNYPYAIGGISLLLASGESLVDVPNDSSFIVDVAVTKTQERNEKDFAFVAVYDTDGALLSLDYVKADFPLNTECSFGFNVPAQEKQVGSIKAYVWNSFTSPEPLAESKTLTFE